jgi:hypothetical protein
VSGLTPCTASVVDFWKKSGTISTRPPMATTTRISTIISRLLVSIFSWVKPVDLFGFGFIVPPQAWAGGGISARTE